MTRAILPLMLVSLMSVGCADDSPRVTTRKKASGAVKPPAETTKVEPKAPEPAQASGYEKIVVVAPAKPAVKPPLIRLENIRSETPFASRDKALHEALVTAQVEIQKKLAAMDPPVLAKPSLATIRREYLKRDTDIQPTAALKDEWKANKLDANRLWVEIDVELTESQVQRLRASERVSDGVRGAGILLALAAAVYGFLRLDAWTKGYLTIWLAVAAFAAVLGALGVYSYAMGW